MRRQLAWGPRWDLDAPAGTYPRKRRFVAPVIVAIFELIGTHFAAQNQGATLSVGAVLLILVGCGALYALPRYRVQTLFFVLANTTLYELLRYPEGPIFFSLAIAFFVNVVRGERIPALVAAAIGWVGFLVIVPAINGHRIFHPAVMLGVTAWVLVLFAGGEIARSARLRALQEMKTRREEARRRAGEQRMRIAHELHDVLAHNISLINVQAGVALHLMDDDPAQARSALVAIRQASDETLREVRSVLDILRDDAEGAPRAPAPGMDDIDPLIRRSSQAGLKVTKEVYGEPRPVPKEVGLAGLRIVQEALTNVTRHSNARAAVVQIRYSKEELQVTVRDDGDPLGAVDPGNGIRGMNERARALGGYLKVGPDPGGGFEVDAHLPLGRPE